MYLAIRVGVGASIMIAYYATRGFGSQLETFVIAFAAALAAQAAALAVKLIAGKQACDRRSIALLVGSLIAIGGCVAFAVTQAR